MILLSSLDNLIKIGAYHMTTNSSPSPTRKQRITETLDRIEKSQKQTQFVVTLSYFLIAVMIACSIYIEVFK